MSIKTPTGAAGPGGERGAESAAHRPPRPALCSCPSDIRFDGRNIGGILCLGAPVALQDVLVSISFLAIAAIVNGLGVVASAGVGVAEKLCGFIMLVPSSFGQSLSAFVAQNIGAGEKTRAKKAMFYGMGTSLCCGLVLVWLPFFHGNLLAGLFARDLDVVTAAERS